MVAAAILCCLLLRFFLLRRRIRVLVLDVTARALVSRVTLLTTQSLVGGAHFTHWHDNEVWVVSWLHFPFKQQMRQYRFKLNLQ